MIRSSALLTAVAMVILVAGVSAGNLGLIYLSIAVSILAAVTLAAGVVLRRRELFGEAAAAPQSAQPGPPAAETAKAGPVPVRPASGDQITSERDGRGEGKWRDRERPGDLAARPREAGSGAAADTDPARWPASIAAKGTPAAARSGGGHSASGGRAARSPSARERAARKPGAGEPAHGDGAGRDQDPGRDQDRAAARQDRERAGRGRSRGGERAGAAAAGADRARTASGRDRDQQAAARTGREQAGRERDEAVAAQRAEAFQLPPPGERTRARAEERGRAISGDPGGNDFWDRVSEELTESGSHDQPGPAWPATAGPRAMGTGAAWDHGVIPRPSGPPEQERDRDEQPAGPGAEPGWDRVVPPYVDEPAGRGGQQRDPEPRPAGAGEPDDDGPRAGAAAGPAASSAWSVWAGARAGARNAAADAEEGGGDPTAHGERASGQETADKAAGAEPDAVGAGGDHEAEAAIQGDDASGASGAGAAVDIDALAGAGQPTEASGSGEHGDAGVRGGAAPRGAERPDDVAGPGETAGAGAGASTSLDDEVTVVPGVPRYHRRGCTLIRFLSDDDLETTTRGAAEAAGSVPCKACQPDKPA